MTIFQRVRAYDWKMEMTVGGFVLGYCVLYFLGSSYNKRLVSNWVQTHQEVFSEQFAQVGCDGENVVIKDDNENFTFFASGRLNIASFVANFKLKPRHDFFVWVLESLMSFFFESIKFPQDTVDITVKLDPEALAKTDDFIWAIVSKEGMSDIRNAHYYLSLTKTTDSPRLPNSFVFMTEASDATDVVFKNHLAEALELSKDCVKLLAVTDQPSDKPESVSDCEPVTHFVLNCKLSTGADSAKLIKSFLTFIDQVANSKGKLKAETYKRIKKTRESEISKIVKIKEQLMREELEEKKLEAQKKARDSLRNLSPEEQKKLEKKQAEKKQRKMMNKTKVRG